MGSCRVPPQDWQPGWRVRHGGRIYILRTNHPLPIGEWTVEYEDSPKQLSTIRYGDAKEVELLDETLEAHRQEEAAKRKRDEWLGEVFGGG